MAKGGISMEEIMALIANFGFPVVICFYLLIRIEGKLEALTASMKDLSKVIAKLL